MSARLDLFVQQGWVLNQDGSTATAHRLWEDPDDPDNGWEIIVQFTTGHGARATLVPLGDGLSERGDTDFARLEQAVAEARLLLTTWDGTVNE